MPDIVYESEDEIWKCCGGTIQERECLNPSDKSFFAPPRDELVEYWVAGSSAAVPSSTVPPTSPTYPPSSAATTTAHLATGGPSSLSSGAKAGIGVGAAAGGILLIAGAFLLICRWCRKRRQTIATAQVFQSPSVTQPPQELPATDKHAPVHELG
jgi:hypothetical protein